MKTSVYDVLQRIESKKIVLRTLDKIMSYLHYKTVANQRRMEWQETLMKTAAHP
jgi:sugar-specific transcriptional regulator TrmB